MDLEASGGGVLDDLNLGLGGHRNTVAS
jgi:hypothetical protein